MWRLTNRAILFFASTAIVFLLVAGTARAQAGVTTHTGTLAEHCTFTPGETIAAVQKLINRLDRTTPCGVPKMLNPGPSAAAALFRSPASTSCHRPVSRRLISF
jgi:hypothetical protein